MPEAAPVTMAVLPEISVAYDLQALRLSYRQVGGLSAAGVRVDVVNPAISRAGENDAGLDDSLLA